MRLVDRMILKGLELKNFRGYEYINEALFTFEQPLLAI